MSHLHLSILLPRSSSTWATLARPSPQCSYFVIIRHSGFLLYKGSPCETTSYSSGMLCTCMCLCAYLSEFVCTSIPIPWTRLGVSLPIATTMTISTDMYRVTGWNSTSYLHLDRYSRWNGFFKKLSSKQAHQSFCLKIRQSTLNYTRPTLSLSIFPLLS